jgi:hypothetical protein
MRFDLTVEYETGVTVDGGVCLTDLFQFIYEQCGRCPLRDVNRKGKRNAAELHDMLVTVVPTVTTEDGARFTVDHMQKLMDFTAQHAGYIDEVLKQDYWLGRQCRKQLKANPHDPELAALACRPLARERVAAALADSGGEQWPS